MQLLLYLCCFSLLFECIIIIINVKSVYSYVDWKCSPVDYWSMKRAATDCEWAEANILNKRNINDVLFNFWSSHWKWHKSLIHSNAQFRTLMMVIMWWCAWKSVQFITMGQSKRLNTSNIQTDGRHDLRWSFVEYRLKMSIPCSFASGKNM